MTNSRDFGADYTQVPGPPVSDLVYRPSKPIIFLDMDGVCCDFANPANRLLAYHTCRAELPVIKWNFFDNYGLNAQQFWRIIESRGEKFWEDLPELPHFWELYRSIAKQGDVFFLSSPSQSPDCLSGKQKWLQTRMGTDFRNFIFTGHKHLFAGPGRILIDDSMENCMAFANAGGVSYCFPQPWNNSPWNPWKTDFRVVW